MISGSKECKDLEYEGHIKEMEIQIQDLAMLVKKFIHKNNKQQTNTALCNIANDYLKRKNLINNLRSNKYESTSEKEKS